MTTINDDEIDRPAFLHAAGKSTNGVRIKANFQTPSQNLETYTFPWALGLLTVNDLVMYSYTIPK